MSCGPMVSGLGGLALGAVDTQDQVAICTVAAQALARGNPAGPGLAQTCLQLRQGNIASGRLLVDPMTLNDPATRVALAEAGRAIIASSSTLGAAAAASGNERAFAIGVACARGGNSAYTAGVRAGMSAADRGGFDLGVKAASPQQQQQQQAGGGGDDGKILGLPTPVAIGVGVGVLGALGFVAYKFLR